MSAAYSLIGVVYESHCVAPEIDSIASRDGRMCYVLDSSISDCYVVPLTSHASYHFVALGQILYMFNNRPLDLHRNNGALHQPATHG